MLILGHEIEMSTRSNESRNSKGDMALETVKFNISMDLFCGAKTVEAESKRQNESALEESSE